MGVVGNLMSAAYAGYSAFRESMLNSDPSRGRASSAFAQDDWWRHEAREVRYAIYWALYQNNSYADRVHPWSALRKSAGGAYRHVRHIYNPAHRIVEFYAGHLMGGDLDREAGDGESTPSALPIVADNAALRPAIARGWRDSRWRVEKDVYTLWGAALGDVGVRICDDSEKGQVRKELVHPAHLRWVEFDERREVQAYLIQRRVPDPRLPGIRDASPFTPPRRANGTVLYTEKCYRGDGDEVVFETYLDTALHDWGSGAATWSEPYGFVPLVVVPHKAIGGHWGMNCFHPGLSRFQEVDDQASCLGDGNRKDFAAPTLLTGVKGAKEVVYAGKDRATMTPEQLAANPEPGRSEKAMLYHPNDMARAHSLVVPRDLPGICEHIRGMLDDVEKNFPELLADVGLGGAVTAEAVRNARQVAASRCRAARVQYDDGEVRSNRMLVAIGGLRGYPGYEDFRGLEGPDDPRLDHSIGHRGVFEVDPMDGLNEDTAFLANANAAKLAGIPLPFWLERNGWTAEDLEALARAQAKEPAPVAVAPGGAGTGVDPNPNPKGVAR